MERWREKEASPEGLDSGLGDLNDMHMCKMVQLCLRSSSEKTTAAMSNMMIM